MDMKIMKSEKRLCPCCMEEHEVKTVLVEETATFKNSKVDYEASYLFCENAEELYMEESQIQENDIRLKNAYRRKQGLLTSEEIVAIRLKYGITQSDLCVLLGWGACEGRDQRKRRDRRSHHQQCEDLYQSSGADSLPRGAGPARRSRDPLFRVQPD